jgi:hypothetical protein
MTSARSIRRQLAPGEIARLAHTARGGPGIPAAAQAGAIVVLSLLASPPSPSVGLRSSATAVGNTPPPSTARSISFEEATRIAVAGQRAAEDAFDRFEADLWGNDVTAAQQARRDAATLESTLGRTRAAEDAADAALLPQTAPAIRAAQAAELRRRDPAAADRARLLARLEGRS